MPSAEVTMAPELPTATNPSGPWVTDQYRSEVRGASPPVDAAGPATDGSGAAWSVLRPAQAQVRTRRTTIAARPGRASRIRHAIARRPHWSATAASLLRPARRYTARHR